MLAIAIYFMIGFLLWPAVRWVISSLATWLYRKIDHFEQQWRKEWPT